MLVGLFSLLLLLLLLLLLPLTLIYRINYQWRQPELLALAAVQR